MNSEQSFHLRDAISGDAALISRLATEIWRLAYPGIISLDQIEYMLKQMYDPALLCSEIESRNLHYSILEIDGVPEGFTAYGLFENDPPADIEPPASSSGALMLHKLYLHPRHHGRGLGRRMMKCMEADAALTPFSAQRVILRVNKRNLKAINAYRRIEYEISGTICSEIGSGFVMDDYWMTKDLAPRETPPPLIRSSTS
jgi:GNAT superfamily N-acetyltransferase